MNDKAIRIYLIESNTLFRKGLLSLFNNETAFLITGDSSSENFTLQKSYQLESDLYIISVNTSFESQIILSQKIKFHFPKSKILFLSQKEDPTAIYKSFTAGINGLVTKSIMYEELLFAIETVSDGGTYYGKHWDHNKLIEFCNTFHISQSKLKSEIRKLSIRESEIIKLIGEGNCNKQIALSLGISVRTVETHRSNIIKKLNLNSGSELISKAAKYFLLEI